MQKSDLYRHNVSHLVVFQSLLRTGNVTSTAAALHMSQPAVSRALAQLRNMFEDPLFVRGPGGVIPTDRAQRLGPRISDIVDELAELISVEEFVPATTDRSFRVATTDYGASTVIKNISAAFSTQAPRASLEVVPFSKDVFRDLSEGRLDLVLFADTTVPDSFNGETLFEESYSFIFRKGHPIWNDRHDGDIPLESFLKWPHILVTVFGGQFGEIDDLLSKKGLSRHIALRMPYFSTAPLIVAQSDLLLTLPTRTAQHFADLANLHCLTAPIGIGTFKYRHIWHPRTGQDLGMSWLRALIKESCAG